MSRRRGLVTDILDTVSSLPWPVGVVLSAIAFIACKLVADRLAVPLSEQGPAALGQTAVHALYGTLARIGEWFLPPLMLVAAGASWWNGRRRGDLFHRVQKSPREVDELSWRNFERLVGEAFRQKGYSVTETGGAGGDGGVDLILKRDSDTTLVQCKQWRQQSVGVKTVRELYGVMTQRRAKGAIIVTAGDFTEEATRFARESGVRLVSGRQLQALVAGVHPMDDQPAENSPSCPRCGSPMVLRTARRGRSAGQQFLGCTRYPQCQGTLPSPS